MELWEVAKKRGRPVKYETPEKLSEACYDYFKWVDDNPYLDHRLTARGEVTGVPKYRPMTIAGLCIYIGMTLETWHRYTEKPGFSEVCKRTNEIIRNNKFSGAAAGHFNHAIIARDLGLVDKVESENKNTNVNLNKEVTEKDLKRRGIPVPDVAIDDVEE